MSLPSGDPVASRIFVFVADGGVGWEPASDMRSDDVAEVIRYNNTGVYGEANRIFLSLSLGHLLSVVKTLLQSDGSAERTTQVEIFSVYQSFMLWQVVLFIVFSHVNNNKGHVLAISLVVYKV